MIVEDTMKHLARSRRAFHSEADFQHALAWMIQKEHPESQVRLEYPIRLLSGSGDAKGAVDIWLSDAQSAIELKYKTSALSCAIEGEPYDLKAGKPHNGRYLFVQDVEKLERLVDGNRVKEGYAILLTNNERLWSKSRSPESASYEFSLVGKLEGKMKWKTKERAPIVLKKRYDLKWVDYSICGDSVFKYLSVRIG